MDQVAFFALCLLGIALPGCKSSPQPIPSPNEPAPEEGAWIEVRMKGTDGEYFGVQVDLPESFTAFGVILRVSATIYMHGISTAPEMVGSSQASLIMAQEGITFESVVVYGLSAHELLITYSETRLQVEM